MEEDLDNSGNAILPGLMTPVQCRETAVLWETGAFRSHVHMARHGFGLGEYRYFAYPLPEPIAALRGQLYPPLAAIANRWAERLGQAQRFPATHREFLNRCHAAGQVRPTPLILRYETGDWNALHQDVYGEHVFPLQVAVLLSAPGRDFEGGEFVLTEQRPRMQSRAEVVPLGQGDAVVFPCASGRSAGAAATIACRCGTASAACARGCASRSALSFTTRLDLASMVSSARGAIMSAERVA